MTLVLYFRPLDGRQGLNIQSQNHFCLKTKDKSSTLYPSRQTWYKGTNEKYTMKCSCLWTNRNIF